MMSPASPRPASAVGHLAYVAKMFPRISETFILNEVIGVERLGVRLQIFRRWGVLGCFFQATYLAEILVRESLTHLHAHFADDPTLVTMFAHYLTGIPYSLRPTPKTFTSKARPSFFGPRPKPRKPRSPARNTTAGIYRLGLGQRATANSIAFIMGWISLSLTSAPHALLMESRP